MYEKIMKNRITRNGSAYRKGKNGKKYMVKKMPKK